MRKYFATSVVFILSLLMFLFYFTKGNILNYLLKPYLETILSQQLEQTVTIEKINISLIRASFQAKNLKVSGSMNCIIPTIDASIQISKLLLGKLALNKAIIQKPLLKLQIIKTSSTRRSSLKIPWAPILQFDFNEISVEDANLFVEKEKSTFNFEHLSLNIRSKQHTKYSIQLSVKQVEDKDENPLFSFEEGLINIDVSSLTKLKGKLSLQGLKFQSYDFNRCSSTFELNNNTLSIENGLLTPSMGLLSFSGKLFFSSSGLIQSGKFRVNEVPIDVALKDEKGNQKLNLVSQDIDLSKLFPESPTTRGSGNLSIWISMGPAETDVQAQLDMKDIFIKNIYLGNVHGSIEKKANKLRSQIIFSHPKRPSLLKLESLLTYKKTWEGSGLISGKQLSLFNEYISKVEIPFSVDDEKVSIPSAYIQKKEGAVRVSGTIDPKRSLNLRISSEKFSLDEINHLSSHYRGELSISGLIEGTFRHPQVYLHFQANHITSDKTSLGDAYVKFMLKDNMISCSSQFFNKQLLLTGILSLDQPKKYELSMEANRFNFTKHIFRQQKEFLDLNGILSGTLHLNGSLTENKIYKGTLDIKTFALKGHEETSFENAQPIRIEMINNALYLKSFWIEGTDTSLKAQGQKLANGELSFISEGYMNLELLRIILPSFQKSSGSAKLSFKLDGTTTNPILFGNLVIKNGVLRTEWFPQTIENLNANFSFSKNKIGINKFDGLVGNGPLRLMGDITLIENHAPKIDLQLEITNGHLKIPEWLSSTTSGHLLFRGTQKPYELSGKLSVSEILYQENIDWQSRILTRKRERYLPKVKDIVPPLFSIDVGIQAPKNVYIRNDLAEIETKLDLILKGTSDQLGLVGKIDLISGTVYFKENKFRLNTTHILFDDPIEMDPKFNIDSETTVKDYKISLSLEGRLSQYNIHLSSQPSLPETDIISLLTLGGTRAEVEKQGLIDLTSLELGSLFFGKIQKTVQKIATQTLGITFSLTPSYSDTKHSTVPRLFIGKKLTRKMDMNFSSTLDKNAIFSEKELDLKYNINRNLSVSGFWEDHSEEVVQDNSNFGVDLKMQFEFR